MLLIQTYRRSLRSVLGSTLELFTSSASAKSGIGEKSSQYRAIALVPR